MFHHPVSHNEAGLELDLRVVHCATMSCDQCLVSGWFYPGSAWSAQVTTGQSEASMESWWPIRVPGYTRSDPGLTFGHQPTWSACSLLSQFDNQIYLHLKASPLSSRLASRTWLVCFCILPKIWRIMISGNQFHELDHRDGQTVRSVLATGATGPGLSRDTWLVLRLRVIMWVLWDHCNIPGQSQHINPRTSLSQQMTGVTFNTWIPPHSDRTGSNIWCLLFIFSK